MAELRCPSKKHGEVIDDHTVEVKCNSTFCGAGPGFVVLHQFDLVTGQLIQTRKYQEIRSK
jgi:hypothetical protein